MRIFDILDQLMIYFRALTKSVPFISALANLLMLGASSAIVINEIHHNPPDNTVRQEFVELFNPGDGEVDLSGWRLS